MIAGQCRSARDSRHHGPPVDLWGVARAAPGDAVGDLLTRSRQLGRAARRGKGCRRQGRETEEKRSIAPLHFQHIAHQGACGKAPVLAQNRRPEPDSAEVSAEVSAEMGDVEMRVSFRVDSNGSGGPNGPATGCACSSLRLEVMS